MEINMEDNISKWEKDVIDTSKNNKLLYFDSKFFLRIKSPSLPFIFDDIVNKDKKMSFHTHEDVDSRKKDEIIVSGGEKLINSLKNIYYRAQSALNEHGTIALYLSFGILKWQDSDGSDVETQLFFVPVEMTRKIYDEYYIESVQGDIFFNPVLREKLDQFNIKFDFNFDENLNIMDAIKSFKSAIKETKWEVKNSVYLGIISFTNNIIYNDLKANHALIMKNDLTRALAGDFDTVKKLNAMMPDNIDYSGIITAMDADSSQLKAVYAARHGASFILNGPPGTGKSQTIANIIIDSISNGKSVLFVSEKKAAIDVVRRRLEENGFGDFLLDLHGNISKSDVIKSFYKSIDSEKNIRNEPMPGDRYTGVLNGYVNSLHQIRENSGISVYDAACRIIKSKTNVHIDIDDKVLKYKYDDIENIRFQLSELADYYDIIRDYFKVPEGFNLNYFKKNKNEFYKSIEDIMASIEYINNHRDQIEKDFKIKLTNIYNYKILFLLACGINYGINITPEDLNIDYTKLNIRLNEYFSKKYDYDKKLGELKKIHGDGILNTDLERLYSLLKNEYKSPFKRMSSSYKEIYAKIRNIYNFTEKKGYGEILEYIGTARAIKLEGNNIKKIELEIGDINHDNIKKIAYISNILNNIKDKKIIDDIPETFKMKDHDLNCDIIRNYILLYRGIRNYKLYFDDSIKINEYDLTKIYENMGTLYKFDLERYIKLVDLMDNLNSQGIKINGILGTEIHDRDILNAFNHEYYTKFLNYYVRNDENLRNFSSNSFERLIKMFREFDIKRMDIYKKGLIYSLYKRKIAAMEKYPEEVMVIKTENAKKKFQKPVKKIFGEIRDILFSIKPCFMASPINVSSYIGVNINFDVVIFDEASQVTPSEAVGSLFRSGQAIISGDTQQLPPTSFFENVNQSKYNENYVVLDNIMDQFDAIGLSKLSLKWHYRSVDDRLIAFSNKYFYDNSLETFPSAYKSSENSGIVFDYVEGTYGRGKSRTNISEANEVVNIIKKEYNYNESIGIVTLSDAQRSAIEDAVTEYSRNDNVLADMINNGNLFIKNLENVQGDERDIIIFSIGYGRDENGKLTMNFGPLNSAGGEKRLNVAITRARKKIIIVSSIKPEDIKVPENAAGSGPELLRRYIHFAVTGDGNTVNKFSSSDEITDDIYEALINSGLKVDKNVGFSKNNIPLGIIDPADKNHYILGIETDGDVYYRMKTPSERERIRNNVLSDRGWNIYRVWSLDYIKNRDAVIRNIINTVNRLSQINDESAGREI
ncbi:AAA domain-containing protein [Acidiplasma sp.]|uniref:AAA domain-containing protein n=1 Tax=Acidiplasma sp. TaxID=1872114 RepID=UPI003167E41E